MAFTKRIKVLLGVLSVWPLFYIVSFLTTFFTLRYFIVTKHSPIVNDLEFVRPLFIGTFLLTMFVSLALKALYIIHAVKAPSVEQRNRVIWVFVLLLGGMVAYPIYWYVQIWRAPSTGPIKTDIS